MEMKKVMQLIETVDQRLERMTLVEHRILAFTLLFGGGFLFLFPDMLKHAFQFGGLVAALSSFYILMRLFDREEREKNARD